VNGRYLVNEWFYSLQGEGVRAGEPSLFVRFAKCNMECRQAPGPRSPGGFDCDTEFESGRWIELDELAIELKEAGPSCEWVVLTGGEPGLQIDDTLIDGLHARGYRLAVETNGSVELPRGLDWVTVSPKVAEHAIRQRVATEVKYVRCYGQAVPRTVVSADHHLISPAFNGMDLDPRTLDWCIRLCKDNPPWRLTVQQHKLYGIL
jgi:7-carboxy-7-deazaguanine synthase